MHLFTLIKHTNNDPIFSGSYNNFSECLEDAVKKEIDLSYVDLRNKNLSNANLDGANMPSAYLSGTNLTGANFSESYLEESIFYNCSLYNTCLSYSNLRGSDFRSANFGATMVDGADIQNCHFSTMSCFDLDFSLIENMNGCLFYTLDGIMHDMSKQPIIIKGFLNTNIVMLDQSVKIGCKIFPKSILPPLGKLLDLTAHIGMGQEIFNLMERFEKQNEQLI